MMLTDSHRLQARENEKNKRQAPEKMTNMHKTQDQPVEAANGFTYLGSFLERASSVRKVSRFII